MRTDRITQGSVEYLEATVTADADLTGSTPSLALTAAGATPSWLTAAWVGTPTTTGVARTSSPHTFDTPGIFTVYVKVADSPEVPVRPVKYVRVVPA